MKRKMLSGLIVAVIALTLGGCKQPEDLGTAPELNMVYRYIF